MRPTIIADLAVWLAPWTGTLATFLLVLARVSGLLSVGPLLGRAILPWQARIGLAVVLSLLLAPLVGSTTLTMADWDALALATATEFGLGFFLGCGSLLILWAIPFTGRLLEQQHALANDEDDDPLGGSPITRWLTLWGAVCFLLCSPINGHLQAVLLLADSFRTWPLGSPTEWLNANVVSQLLQHASQLALLLIAPALATLTLINLAISLLGAANLPGAAAVLGNTLRPFIAVLVLMMSLSGLQQTIAESVRGGIAALTGDVALAH